MKEKVWIVVALALLAVVGIATAQSTKSDTIRACYGKEGGDLRVLAKSSAKCRRGERALSWNKRGPAGVNGLAGADGQDGSTGPAGADGAEGATGPAGPGAGFGFRGAILGNTPLPVNTPTAGPGTMTIAAKVGGIVLIQGTVIVAAGATGTRVTCAFTQTNEAGEDPFDQFLNRNFLVTLVPNESKTFPIMAEARTSGGTAVNPRDHRIGITCNAIDAAATFRESYVQASLLGE